jgi:hypothetical protein
LPINPRSRVKGWQRLQANGSGRALQAVAAWRRFCFCVAAMPEREAQAMWAMVKADAAAT